MRKYKVLRAVVILQAVCMVVLTVVVVIKVWPGNNRLIDPQPQTNIGSDEGTAEPDKPEQTPDSPEKADPNRTIAKVGPVLITAAELESQLYKQYGDDVLRAMMVHKAIDLEAAASELSVSQEELQQELEKMIDGYDSEARYFEVMKEQLGMTKAQVQDEMRYRLLLEKIAIRSIVVTDLEVEKYITEHPDEYGSTLQLHLLWILTETEKEAESVLDLLSDGEDFSLLASSYSLDSFTADIGGDLGLIDEKDPFYDRNMLDAASKLQVAETAGPIKVDGGYAIIRLLERQVTSELMGSRLQDVVRKQLALEKADSLNELEDRLLDKYDAVQTP